jgi:hypothetical protein
VDQDGTAGLLLAQQILHQIDPQPGELGVELEAQIRLLRFLDLIDFVSGQKIALCRQRECKKQAC